MLKLLVLKIQKSVLQICFLGQQKIVRFYQKNYQK